jgi:hypothetical protein
MRRVPSAIRAIRWSALMAGLAIGWLLVGPSPASCRGQEMPSRQLVMFGVVATPGSNEMDKKITPAVAAQLRKALPNHGFKLIEVKSQRVVTHESVMLKLGDGFETTATLVNAFDPNGKVQLRYDLSYQGISQFQTIVNTPADQFNYFDKVLPNNSHLLIGVGAR